MRTLARIEATSTTVTMPMTIPSTARMERRGCAATESWVRRTVSSREIEPLPEVRWARRSGAHSALTAAMMSMRDALRAG